MLLLVWATGCWPTISIQYQRAFHASTAMPVKAYAEVDGKDPFDEQCWLERSFPPACSNGFKTA